MSAAEAWGLIPALALTRYPLQKKNSTLLRVSICSRFVQGFSKGLNDQKDLSRCATYGSGFPASLCSPEVPEHNSRSHIGSIHSKGEATPFISSTGCLHPLLLPAMHTLADLERPFPCSVSGLFQICKPAAAIALPERGTPLPLPA